MKIQIPMYAGLLSVNVTFFFPYHDQIIVKYFVWHIAGFYFLSFPLFFRIQHYSLTCATLIHFSHHFFLLLFFFVGLIQHVNIDIEIDWILIRDVFFLVLILASTDAMGQWLSLLHNFIQQSLNSGSAQVQILLAACWKSWWWGSLTMVLAGNKVKCLSSVIRTTKTIYHHHHHHHHHHHQVKFQIFIMNHIFSLSKKLGTNFLTLPIGMF